MSAAAPIRFALGVGLTNACNLACKHCYRAPGEDRLEVERVLRAVDALPTRAVNLGTGENGLHPGLATLVNALFDRGVAVTMTTNGYSTRALPDEVLKKFRDVEFSIDYPTREAHDTARGLGNWALIETEMARCRGLGIGVTLVSVLMSTNCTQLPGLAALAFARGAKLRLTVYQAVNGDAFSLSYEQFWQAFATLLELGELEACGEPVVRAVLGLPRAPGAGCGVETVRITPKGVVSPCVYTGTDSPLSVEDLVKLGSEVVKHASFRALDATPDACKACPQLETCGGGCPSRRTLRGGLQHPDEYCPFVLGRPAPLLNARRADPSTPIAPKASSACTTILAPRYS